LTDEELKKTKRKNCTALFPRIIINRERLEGNLDTFPSPTCDVRGRREEGTSGETVCEASAPSIYMNFQVNFYKLTRAGRISMRSSLQPGPLEHRAYMQGPSGSGSAASAAPPTPTPLGGPVSRDNVGAGLIMSPTRNRNFVRRVPDKSAAKGRGGHPSHRRRVRGGAWGERAANEARRNLLFRRARSRGEITRCHTLLVARLLSGPREILSGAPRGEPGPGPPSTPFKGGRASERADTLSNIKRIPLRSRNYHCTLICASALTDLAADG